MIKQAVDFALAMRTNLHSRRKTKEILAHVSKIEIPQIILKEFKQKWRPFVRQPDVNYLRIFSAINGKITPSYVPENVYLGKIEPVLNRRAFSLAYADKNFYERYLNDLSGIFPKTFLRGIHGALYNQFYQSIHSPDEIQGIMEDGQEYIVKPAIETCGGRNVTLIKFINGKFICGVYVLSMAQLISFLRNRFNNNFVFQERIENHPFFSRFNSSSLNTIRIVTFRSPFNERIIPLHAVLRFGMKGSIVDNQASGGRSIGVSPTGKLNHFSVDKIGRKTTDLPMLEGASFQSVPYFDEMKALSSRIAGRYSFHRIIGFDFCLTRENEVKLLEINCKNLETNFLQMNNGPLFAEHTDEVIEHCRHLKRGIVLNFEISA